MRSGTWLVDELADRAHAVAAEPLPESVRNAARAHVTDTVAALVAGHATLGPAVRRLGGESSPDGPTVALPPGRVAARPPGMAAAGPFRARQLAFAAGVYVHCWEAEGIHRSAVLCPGCAVLPATLAVLDQRPEVTWEEYLRAYTAGYEVALAAGLAVRGDRLLERGWWPTAMVAPLGGAAAASVLLGRSAATTASAIALAAQQAGGTVAGSTIGADGRYLLGGLTAERSVSAVQAADAGWRGPRDILDDARSPLRRCDDPAAVPGTFLLPQTSIKAHTCAKQLQAAVDAVLALREETGRWDGEPPLAIDCALPGRFVRIVDRPPPFGSALNALASAQFVLALAATRGRCVPRDFEDGAMEDPALVALAERVRVRASDELSDDYPARWGASVTVTTASGVHHAERREARGDPGSELTDAELAGKFTALAAPSLGEEPARELAVSMVTGSSDAPVRPLTERILPLIRPGSTPARDHDRDGGPEALTRR
jgi:2-methylcitrate dehydratase PrpD